MRARFHRLRPPGSGHPRSHYDPIPQPPNPHFSRAQGMYTCIHGTGGEFLAGMCATGISLLLSCDHPHPRYRGPESLVDSGPIGTIRHVSESGA
jgi:hypothetical protein